MDEKSLVTLNKERLNSICGNDLEFSNEFINISIKSLLDDNKSLIQYCDNKDTDSVKSIIHKIKGTAGNVGGNKLVSLIIENESYILDNNSFIANDISRISVELNLLISELKEYKRLL